MKKQILLLLLLLAGMAKAQIVNIPDPFFKQLLLQSAGVDNNGNSIIINTNGDGEIQVSEALAIWELHINLDFVSVEGIGAFTNLRVLTFFSPTSLQSLDITALANLETFSISFADNLESLVLAGLSNLKSIYIHEARAVSSLDFTGLTSLEEVEIDAMYDLTSLTTAGLPALVKFDLSDSYTIQSLDLSGCTALEDFRLDDFHDLQYLNLKNGKLDYSNLDFGNGGASVCFICIDEGEEVSLAGEIDIQSGQFLISTYCSFEPGGDSNRIEGVFTYDADGNGCGAGNILPRHLKVNVAYDAQDYITFSNSLGEYGFYVPTGTFILTPQTESSWFIFSPPSATVAFSEVDNGTTTQNFCIAPVGVHPNVAVTLFPIESVQPGFDARYKVVYSNKGNQSLSGTITLSYDDSVLDYVEATPVEASSSAGSLVWNYSNLLPFETRSVIVTLNLNGPMETPAVNLGDQLAFSASISPVAGDETPADNTFATTVVVDGSYDPNDITCLEGDSVSPEKIGEYLHYNINFENTGTAPATFIVVKDIIDEAKFDVASFQLLESSHEVEARITGNKAEFIFDNINLGPAGKGNVLFKIKTLPTLQVNSEVTQQADIFFDYNWPIQTNEATTTFEVLSRGDFEKDNSIKVYPNPSATIVTITADSTLQTIQLFDVQGRLLETGIINDISATVDLSARAAGMYFVKVTTDKGSKVEKVVKE